MDVPDWKTSTKGTRTRVAMWLFSEVGEGGTFTKAQLRAAFPGVEQIDRRMRDLRTEGWVLATYREDRYLSPDELRLVQVGGHVWNPAYRSRQSMSITDKERQAVFAADNFCCTRCGIGGGEPFADDALRTAKLTVARVTSLTSDLPMLSTLCDRCHVASRDEPAAPDLVHRLDALDEAARERLRQWVRAGVRPQSAEEVLWGEYRRLPAAARQHFIQTLLSL